MAFASRNFNNSPNVSVNTRLQTFYSDESMLTLTAWNQNLSLRIQPCTGKDANGIRQYSQDQAQAILTSITPDNAVALAEAADTILLPAIKDGNAKTVSVAIRAKDTQKILTLGYNGNTSYLEIALNVNPDGSCSKDSIIHHTFNTRTFIEDYNFANGNGEEIEISTELLQFIKRLEDMKYFLGTVNHGIRYDAAVHSAYQNSSVTTNSSPAPFQPSSTSSYSAPVTNVPGIDMSDFLPMQ